LGLALFTIAQAAESAGAPTAVVTGRVQNVVTGQYLNNARVAVRDTGEVAFTDESGTYLLTRVPAGSITLEVFYTGLDAQAIPLQLAPGRSIVRNVELTSAARYGTGEVVTLDPFVAVANRETDAQAIASNEQRFAPNLKNVLSTDSLGDVFGSSVGEFLKFVPGVVAAYDNASIIRATKSATRSV